MVRTRSEVHNNPTVIDLKQQARAKRNQEWLAFYETLRNAIVSGEVKDYFAGQTVEDDEERDKMRLFIRLLSEFSFEKHIPVNKEMLPCYLGNWTSPLVERLIPVLQKL